MPKPPTLPREQLLRLSDTIHKLAVNYHTAQMLQNRGRQDVAGEYGKDALQLARDVKQRIAECRTALADPAVQNAYPEVQGQHGLLKALDEIAAMCDHPLDGVTAGEWLGLLRLLGRQLQNAVEALPPQGPLLEALENAGQKREDLLVANQPVQQAGSLLRQEAERLRQQPASVHPENNCIVSLGDRCYRIGELDAKVVTEREENVLQAFLKRSALDQKQLSKASALEPEVAARVLRGLTKKYQGMFAPAITMPRARGKGGYHVRIRQQ
jgi:hypothetical protein